MSLASYAAINMLVFQRRTAKKLVAPPLIVVLLRIVVITGALILAAALSSSRSKGPVTLKGVPWIAPIVGVLLVIWTFVQHRTAFGRYVYSVGSNAEAFRRAGIRAVSRRRRAGPAR